VSFCHLPVPLLWQLLTLALLTLIVEVGPGIKTLPANIQKAAVV
jgi:hypothetical protein